MTLTEDLRSIADMDPSFIAIGIEELEESEVEDEGLGSTGRMRGLRRAARRVAPDRSVLTSGLAMSAACIGSLLVASALHRGAPWAGVNAVTSGLGLVGRRPPTSFDARLAAISFGSIVGGSLIVAALANKLTPARGFGRIGGGILAAAGSFAMDRFLMRRTLMPALKRSLGPVGMAVTYGAIGLAAILGRRMRRA
jgi:hypothetical protein